VLLNGQAADIGAIEAELIKLKKDNGSLWYFRESSLTGPPPQAKEVIDLVLKYKLPISFSSKPDFSDYIDEDGHSIPRNP
jgi:hypothetical protein